MTREHFASTVFDVINWCLACYGGWVFGQKAVGWLVKKARNRGY